MLSSRVIEIAKNVLCTDMLCNGLTVNTGVNNVTFLFDDNLSEFSFNMWIKQPVLIDPFGLFILPLAKVVQMSKFI